MNGSGSHPVISSRSGREAEKIPRVEALGPGPTAGSFQAVDVGWAIGYNAIAIPIAAGVFPATCWLVLRPEIAALAMSGASFIVAVNALLLRLRLPREHAAISHLSGSPEDVYAAVRSWVEACAETDEPVESRRHPSGDAPMTPQREGVTNLSDFRRRE